MRVTLCIPRKKGGLTIRTLELAEGAAASEALAAAGLAPDTAFGIFCQKAAPDTVLSEGDRLDIAVPLALTPMQVRRLRAESKDTAGIPRPRHGGIHQLIKPTDESIL
jgi:hypothetical protein